MSRKMTRRDLAAVLSSAAGARALRAQDSQPSQPEDLNAAAREQNRKHSEAMAKVGVPISIEPSFQFKA